MGSIISHHNWLYDRLGVQIMSTVNPVGNGLTGASGTGNFAGNVSPSFTTPALGTPSAGVLSSCTAYAQSALTGLGTGISTALGINVGTAGSPVVNGGALGTPSSGTLTSCTGLPIAGSTGYGTGVATALAANVTGTGSIVLANTPTLITPVLGVATATSITFGAGVLSTYVTGTWTPVFTSDGGGTATYTVQQASYTKIGNRVMFDIFMVLSALPNAGNVTITGLPVTAGSTSSISMQCSALQVSVTSPLMGYVIAGGTVITLFTFATGSATQLTVGGCTSASQFIITGSYNAGGS